MESTAKRLLWLLCDNAASAGRVTYAYTQLAALWVESVDAGRVATASASKEFELLLLKRDLEPLFLRCAELCTNGLVLRGMHDAIHTSNAVFADVRAPFSVHLIVCGYVGLPCSCFAKATFLYTASRASSRPRTRCVISSQQCGGRGRGGGGMRVPSHFYYCILAMQLVCRSTGTLALRPSTAPSAAGVGATKVVRGNELAPFACPLLER